MSRISKRRRWRRRLIGAAIAAAGASVAIAGYLAVDAMLTSQDAAGSPGSEAGLEAESPGAGDHGDARAGAEASQAKAAQRAATGRAGQLGDKPLESLEGRGGRAAEAAGAGPRVAIQKQPIVKRMGGKLHTLKGTRPPVKPRRLGAPSGSNGDAKKARRIILAQYWADVLLDGRKVGRVPPPLPLDLTMGTHRIELRNAFCEPARLEVKIDSPGEERLPVHLHCPAKLQLAAPPGALVFVDQELKGSTPMKGPIELDWPEPALEKKVTLRITKRDHVPFEKELVLKRGTVRRLNITLPPEER